MRQPGQKLVFAIYAAVCAAAMLLTPAAHAQLFPNDIETMRDRYREAATALKHKRYQEYEQLLQSLEGYVLKGYVEYDYLKSRIARMPNERLHNFIKEYDYLPISDWLRTSWLHHLARAGDWETFLAEYKPQYADSRLQCLRLQHLVKHSQDQAAVMSEVRESWLTGRRMPQQCDAVFKHWADAGHMSDDLVWARIKLAMESRRVSLARALARRYLPRSQYIWMQRWESVHWNPQRELSRISYKVETPVARMIVKHGVVRLAYRDPDAAMALWEHLKHRFDFFGEDENYVLRMVGVLAAQNHSPMAVDWLSRVTAREDDANLRIWRVKAALRTAQWDKARAFLGGLNVEEQQETRWRYWRARILEETGEAEQARQLYLALTQERDYYGFLAADRLDREYAMRHRSVETSPEELSAMLSRKGVQAAHELYSIGETLAARRQWNWVTRRMNNRELEVAAVVARHWGWYDRAIYTVTKADHFDDLDLRFPVLYRDQVHANAERAGIDPSWIYGVMRQESAFVADARSPAGALGLMQLMPRTGRQVGRRLNMRIRNNSAILDIENNLLLGASYLKAVLDRNNGSEVLATASYNAGPHRVKRWLPEENMAADVWVETIPYDETRNYVKNVLSFTAVYDHRLGGEPKPLEKRMPLVVPDAQ